MLGKTTLSHWTAVFMPITHVCRHMWWPLTPEDHLSPWAMICWMTSHMVSFAIEGRVRLVCGGPNCRTWSILRWFPQSPMRQLPVRGRSEDLVWGLPTLTLEQEEVDGDSLLILRQMFLMTLMKQNCSLPVASFLEHPRDPLECSSSPSAARCSSLWATKAFKAWYPTVGHTLDNWYRRPHPFPLTWLFNAGMDSVATILRTSSQKICNPPT